MNCVWASHIMTCGTSIHFMRPRSWFYLMVTRCLFDGTHLNSISSFYDGCSNQDWAISRDLKHCDDRSHILFGEIKNQESWSVFVILSADFEVRSLWQGMTKQIINNFPSDLDLKDILHNSVVTRRQTDARWDDIFDNAYHSDRHL